MSSSLDNLVSLLDKEQDFEFLKKQIHYDEQKFKLLCRKGVMPYDYLNDKEKLKETSLPPREEFYSQLNDENISNDDYEHAKKVWDIVLTGERKTMLDYLLMYMWLDIILLACVMENFRKLCMSDFGLDPPHYVSLPSLAFDCCLKFTKKTIELFTDCNQQIMVERGIRGGIVQAVCRREQANNKLMGDEYDPEKPENYIMYYDIVNLYGFAMTQPLPLSDFHFVENDILLNDPGRFYSFLMSIPENSDTGYICEVDVEYDKFFHDFHANLPFLPEHLNPFKSNQKKLLTTLYDKKNYVAHYKLLQQAVKHGLRITKVHQIISFHQENWLAPYVEKNNYLRSIATSAFGKKLRKDFINIIYGKFAENVRKRTKIRLCTEFDGTHGAGKVIALHNFKRVVHFNENFVGIELKQLEVKVTKQMSIALAILDISKVQLYKFLYEFLYKKYRYQDCKLLYCDTDSLILSLYNQNPYEMMKKNISEFDTSNYTIDNLHNMPIANKQVLGLMKDELAGESITDVICLRAKTYSYRVLKDGKKCDKKVCKGVKREIMRKTVTFNDFDYCLNNLVSISRNQNLIRSKRHKIFTIRERKIALNANDDKRFICEDGLSTIPWGHYSIRDDYKLAGK